MKKSFFLYLLVLVFACTQVYLYAQTGKGTFSIPQNQVIEWSYFSKKSYPNPFFEVELTIAVENPDGTKLQIPAFWNGNNQWTFRFSSSKIGTYRFVTVCSDTLNAALHHQKGQIMVTAYKGPNELYQHGAIRLSADKRYFQHSDGKPFFWLADSWWFGMSQRLKWPNDFKLLVADRKQKGFSVVQFAVGFACDIAPFDPRDANEAGFAWTANYQTINPDYFKKTDLRIQWLVQQGLMPNLVAAWGYYLPFMGIEKMKKHWRYLIARYGAYPLTWTLCGEVAMPWYLAENQAEQKQWQREKWAEISHFVRTTDPYRRLLTVHPGGEGVAQPLTEMSQIDFTMAMPGHNGFHTVARALTQLKDLQTRYPDKPAMQGEISFEGMYGSSKEDVQRIFFWSNMLSGAVGHCYGADALWQFNTLQKPFGKSPLGHIWGNTPWEIAYQWAGATQVGVGKKILEKYPFHQLKPSQSLIEPAASEKDVFQPYCAATPDDSLRILYFARGIAPWNQNYTLKKLQPNAHYLVQYIDPITGNLGDEKHITSTEQGTWKIAAAPILQDWVVVVKKN